jgi:hypothetical protein
MAIKWPWATGEEVDLLRAEITTLERMIVTLHGSLSEQAEANHKATCALIAGIGGRIDDVTAEKRVTHRPKSWSAAKSLMGEGN